GRAMSVEIPMTSSLRCLVVVQEPREPTSTRIAYSRGGDFTHEPCPSSITVRVLRCHTSCARLRHWLARREQNSRKAPACHRADTHRHRRSDYYPCRADTARQPERRAFSARSRLKSPPFVLDGNA